MPLLRDPLYAARRTLHIGTNLLTDRQHQRLIALFANQDLLQVEATWGIYRRMIVAYREPDKQHGRQLRQAVIDSVADGVPAAHPAPARPTWPPTLAVAAARRRRVLFATATDWVARLSKAHDRGRLPAHLTRLRRYGLIIVDEVGYLPFEQDAVNLFFQLVSSALRTRLPDPGLHPAVQLLGRGLRRPGHRRRDDRPDRPPRRHRPQRRLLPPPRPRHHHPAQHQGRTRIPTLKPFTLRPPRPTRFKRRRQSADAIA